LQDLSLEDIKFRDPHMYFLGIQLPNTMYRCDLAWKKHPAYKEHKKEV